MDKIKTLITFFFIVLMILVATFVLLERKPKHLRILGDFVGTAYAQGMGMSGFKHDAGHPDTNSKEMQHWISSLTNNQGGSCCGEGDGYHAIVDKEASPGVIGHGHVIDADKPREIWVNGWLIKTIPPLTGDPNFTFDYNHVVKEKYGNPAKHAWVFLNTKQDGSIDRNNSNYRDGVYCLVPLPPAF